MLKKNTKNEGRRNKMSIWDEKQRGSNAEAEAKEADGTCKDIMLSDDVKAAGETGEGHPGHRTVNEEAGISYCTSNMSNTTRA